MMEIFRDDGTVIRKDDNCLFISRSGLEERISVHDLETVAELSPCVTMGRYLDLRVVTIRARGKDPLFIPVSKDGAKKILKEIQQCKLDAARHVKIS